MKIEELLAKLAEKQLNAATGAVKDAQWLDQLISKLESEISNLPEASVERLASQEALSSLKRNRNELSKLGVEALTLVIQQAASGKLENAANLYVQATGTADELIRAMSDQTKSLILAKKHLDEMYAEAWRIVKDIAIAGARQLLPYLLSMIQIKT